MSKTRMGKRVASLLLSLVMMLSLLPTTVYATEDTVGGTGEANGVIVGEANTSDDNTVGTGEPEPTGEDEGGGTANVSEGEDGAATNDAVVEETIAPVNAEGVDAVANAESTGDEVSGEDGSEAGNKAETYVAQVGDTKYATLKDAIAAAEAGQTVTLLANVKLTSTQAIRKQLTIDLNGKTISSTAYRTIQLNAGAVLTVKDSASVGKITNTYTGSAYPSTIYLIDAGAKFTLESGTIESDPNVTSLQSVAINSEKNRACEVNIKGGSVTVPEDATNGRAIVASTNSMTLNISGGTITGGLHGVDAYGGSTVNITGGKITARVVDTGVIKEAYGMRLIGTAKVTVAGGTITGVKMDDDGYKLDVPAVKLESGTIKGSFYSISKGTITFDVAENADIVLENASAEQFLPDTVKLVEKENGTYGVVEAATAVAQIGETTYGTLAEAFAAAKDGDTITLLTDCSGDGISVKAETFTAKGLTVDFAGHNYTVGGKLVGSSGTMSNGFQLNKNNKITFQNGAIYGDASVAGDDTTSWSGAPAMMIQNYCNLTLQNMTVVGGKETCYTLSNNNGNVVIEDTTIKAGNGTQYGPFAFDICRYSGYPSVSVTVKGNSVIEGNVEVSGTIGEGQSRQLNIEGGTFKGTFTITGNVPANIAISGGTFKAAVPAEYCAEGFIPTKNTDNTYGVKQVVYVAETNGVKYETLQEAIDAAARNATVKLLADTKENVTIAKAMTLDLNGFTLNGSTGERKPALTVTASVTVKDSSEKQTGTIMREDTAGNSGVSSHYVIDIQGNSQGKGWLTFESGNVTNNSGNEAGKGASLVRVGDDSVTKQPGLVINGGTFTQDNFIVIKVDRGYLNLNGGTLKSANSYAVENWFNANIKGGTVNGAVSSWTYSGGSNSTLTISGGTVNGDVESVSYDGAEGKLAKVKITGGTVNGTLSTKCYSNATASSKDMATIEVTGGTFKENPTKYVVEGSAVNTNADGTFGVKQQEQQELAKVGDTRYYTMDDAFQAVKKDETITLLRDYTTGAEQYSGSKSFAIDLAGHTWTYTGTNTDCAAFQINYPNVTLTVKNGTVVSGSMVGLIPSAMGGTITYDNAGLVFEGVTMTANGHSGIETNGNNTNDTVTLKNSTLDVPNGFGIYFPSSGTLTIDNSTINAKTMGVQVCAGSLSINAGSAITVSGDAVPKTINDGAIEDGAAISIVNRAGYKGLGDVTVTGGTFKANGTNEAIKAYDWNNTNKGEETFTANDKVAVSGGSFSSAVPEGLCATGYIPTTNSDGTYGVKEGQYVAYVGKSTNKFETLQKAIDAARDNQTVRLLADITLTETAVFPEGRKVSINLQGHKITATGTALRINGTTEINSSKAGAPDAAQTGMIESTNNVAVAVGDNASLTVYSGTLKGREGAVITGTSTGAKIEIRTTKPTLIATDNAVIAGNGSQRDGKPNTILVKGGTFIGNIKTTGYIACGIYAPWNDNVTVSGGTFNITNGAGIVARAGTVKVTGGTFNCGDGTAKGWVGDSKNNVPNAALVFDKAANYPALTTDSEILVSGGSFSTDPAANGATLADGYVATQTDGMYKVAKANPVAEINGVKYGTLQAAINAAQAAKGGATITLLKNINTESYYTVNGDNPVTINLAGYNITGSGISGLFYVTAKGDLTIKGEGTVTAVEDNGAAMAVWVYSPTAKVTLAGGTYKQTITNTADTHFDLIYVTYGTVYIKGGTYEGATPDWTLNCKDETYQSKEAKIEVTGGTFVDFDPSNNKAEGENTNFVPAGYVSTKGADSYTVEKYLPVEIWTAYSGTKVASYATIEEAVTNLGTNQWLVIAKDYTLSADFTIPTGVYLDVAKDATLTVAEGVTLTVAAKAKRLGVRAGATLVNNGTILVRGSSTSNGFAMLYGTFTGNELTVPNGCFLDNNGKNFFATANGDAVYEITFGDGTVKKTADSTNIEGGNVKQIKLLKDVTVGGWTLDSSTVGAEVVLDLNGHTISSNGANPYYATLNVYTKVTIKNGTVKYEGSKRGAIDLVGQGDLTIEGDVTINGGNAFAIFTSGTSKLTVNGTVKANGNYAIAGNGSKDAGGYIDSCNITVNDGAVISAPNGIAIYHPEKGTVTINGGTISGHTGIEMCAGGLVVNGGSITSNGANMDATGSLNAILDGAAISIINRNYPGGVPTAEIKGGTFAANGKDAQTVKAYDYTGDKVAEWTAAGDHVNISGGSFNSIPTNMGALCKVGYKTVYDKDAGMYDVVPADAKITVGKRLSIGNDLTITYLVSLTDCTGPWVKFQFYNDDIKGYTTVEVKNYGTTTVEGPNRNPVEVFTFDFTGVNPQRMTDTLKATVYAKDASGNVVEYQVADYSVAQYCSNKLAKLGQDDSLRKLIGNLVAYGAAAQVYQNYRTDNLVSTVVSSAVSTDYTDRLSSVTRYTGKVTGAAGVTIKGKTLVLSNTFAVRVYFTVNKGIDIANVSFKVTANGKADTVNSFEKDEKLGYYYFDYANLNATQLDSEVKFESFVNETGAGDMVTYSVNTYLAKKMPNYDKSSNAYKLMAELFNYGCACTEYASK